MHEPKNESGVYHWRKLFAFPEGKWYESETLFPYSKYKESVRPDPETPRRRDEHFKELDQIVITKHDGYFIVEIPDLVIPEE